MMRSAMLLAVGALLLAAPAHATVYDITYAGTGDFGGAGYATARGTGSFTIAGDPAHATLDAISAFSFTLWMPGAAPVTYGFGDLPTFKAVAVHGTLIALLPPTGAAMWTEAVEATRAPRGFTGEASSSDFMVNLGGGEMVLAQTGGGGNLPLDSTVIPEPATLAVLGMGLISLGWLRRRGGWASY